MTIWNVISHYPVDINGFFGSYTNLALAARDVMCDVKSLDLQILKISSLENYCTLVCYDWRNNEEYSYTFIKATVNDICL